MNSGISTCLIIFGFIFIYIITILTSNIKNVKNNWDKYKCNPMFTPFSKYFSDEDPTIVKNKCDSVAGSAILDSLLVPIKDMQQKTLSLGQELIESSNETKANQKETKETTGSITSSIFNKFNDINIVIQKGILTVKDMISRIIGLFGLVIYVFQVIGNSLLSIISMVDDATSLCFDGDTIIPLNNSIEKKIKDIEPNDILADGSRVTSIFKLNNKYHYLYKINNIFVTGKHSIKHNGKWIYVNKHPNAILTSKKPKQLYCLNTDSKTIKINDILFGDWDKEVTTNEIDELKKIYPNITAKNMHMFVESGYNEDTLLVNCKYDIKKIKDIEPGDYLYNNIEVLGIVKTSTKDINLYTKEGIISTDKSTKPYNNSNIEFIYHLITDQEYFWINNKKHSHYSSNINRYLPNWNIN